MAPETHTRYRVQKLIRMGEWLERNAPALVTAFDALDAAHDFIGESENCSDDAFFMMFNPIRSLQMCMMELRCDDWGVERGKDVTLYHQFAAEDKKYEVVIEAPKPQLDASA